MLYRKAAALGVLALLLALLPFSAPTHASARAGMPSAAANAGSLARTPRPSPAPKAELPQHVWAPAALQSVAKPFLSLPPRQCAKNRLYFRRLAARSAAPPVAFAAFQCFMAHPHHAPPAA